MLKYLIVLLDDQSTSYCHYSNKKTGCKLISLENLKAGILFAMKENLLIQFVYPHYILPKEYEDTIEAINHGKIVPISYSGEADVIVLEDCKLLGSMQYNAKTAYVLKLLKEDFFKNWEIISGILDKVARLNIVLSDVETFKNEDFEQYKLALKGLVIRLEKLYNDGSFPQLNLLTDRMMLDKMNNCNAGIENITLAPNGKFYICPAFYQFDETDSVGDTLKGLNVKNPQLFRLDHAPLCGNCDAYQCKRCIWLNKKNTLEVNIPSHEQCVTAHLERNATRELLQRLNKNSFSYPFSEIKELSYLDPFEERENW